MKYCSQGGSREKTKLDDNNNHYYYITGNVVSALLIMNERGILVRVMAAAEDSIKEKPIENIFRIHMK